MTTMMNYIDWLLGHIYYKLIRLVSEPNEVYEINGWRYEVDYLDFGLFQQIHTHSERIVKLTFKEYEESLNK